jgi:hypothetical protein
MPSLRDSVGFIGREFQALARLVNACHGSAVQEEWSMKCLRKNPMALAMSAPHETRMAPSADPV